MASAVRERVHHWQDPELTAAAAGNRDGLAFLRAGASAELPIAPVAGTLGFALREVEPGRVVLELEPAEFHYNPIGSVHGGVLATVLDSAVGCAVHSMLPAGARYTSLDLSVKFIRPVYAGTGLLRCQGTVVHLGRRTALAEARLTGPDSRLYAHATSSLMIFQPPGES
jgi:uncharacterized protein (TIGR00369 family)